MDPSQLQDGLYDPTKARLPRRFRNKMPSLKHLKTHPCVAVWSDLVHCYTMNSFDANRCVAQAFAFEECKKNTKSTKTRVGEARFYLRNVMRSVKEATLKRGLRLIQLGVGGVWVSNKNEGGKCGLWW